MTAQEKYARLLETLRSLESVVVAFSGGVDSPAMRRALVYGSVIASFAVEDFSLNRLTRLTRDEIDQRYEAFGDLTRLEASPR